MLQKNIIGLKKVCQAYMKNQFGQFQTPVCKAKNSSLDKEKLEFGQYSGLAVKNIEVNFIFLARLFVSLQKF